MTPYDDDLTRRLTDEVDSATPPTPPAYAGVVDRFSVRQRRRRAAVASASVAAVLAVVAVGTQVIGDDRDSGDSVGPATSAPVPSETTAEPWQPDNYPWKRTPPPVVVHTAERDIELEVGHFCWNGPPDDDGTQPGLCASIVPEPTRLAGSPAAVEFGFPVDGYRFTATFQEAGKRCGRWIDVPVEKTGERTFRVTPAGPAGDWEVHLFGRGPRGSVSGSITWTTPTDGTLNEPNGYLALVSDTGSELHGYDGELGISDLAATPETATASARVTAANGASMTIPFHLDRNAFCDVDGSLFFRGEEGSGAAAALLGPAPFTYEVRLVMDGREYVGTAVYPRDEKQDEAPNTVLTFEPPLPAYTGD